MRTHHLHLASAPFEAISADRKTIESRLYDDKRQLINLGDTLIFTNREDASQTISVRVIGLLRYRTFSELFTHNDAAKFGNASVGQLLRQIEEFYPLPDQQATGVIGIEFKKP